MVAPVRAQVANQAPELDQVDVDEHLLAPVPGDLTFRDEAGRTVKLSSLLDGQRPVLLVLAYHRCEILCSLVLNGTLDAMRETAWAAGDRYQFLSISIDPSDTPASAAERRSQAAARYQRTTSDGDLHFWVGEQEAIDRLTASLGFRYFYDERQDQYAHPAVIVLLTPDGRIARYLYGIQFAPEDLRLGLLEASEGRSISTVERVLLFCYRYDPQGGKYALMATRVMQIGGALIFATVFTALGLLWRREVVRRRIATREAAAAAADVAHRGEAKA